MENLDPFFRLSIPYGIKNVGSHGNVTKIRCNGSRSAFIHRKQLPVTCRSFDEQ